MAYDPYRHVNEIYKLKGIWDDANKKGDTATKSDAAAKAQYYYGLLRNNGYTDIADKLSKADYTGAKKINDTYAKAGKVKTRDYLYTLGKSKGLTSTDVDKLISYDNDTGEISFGGLNVGKPDSVVDGVSYWDDTTKLDNAFNDYVSKSGTVRSGDVAVNQENEELFKKYSQEYEDLKKTNPFETDEGKAILAKYDLAGLQGRDNAVATGGASNGGNIDSYAAANALRQQTALVNQGQMTVLESYNQRLEHARNLLSDMGVNIDRVYNQNETSKSNQVSRDVATSESTGFVTDEQLKSSSSLWDGGMVNSKIDYQAQINRIQKLYNTTNSQSEKQQYAIALKLLEMARNDKIKQTGSSEAPTYNFQSLINNANTTLTREQIESAERIATAGNETALAQTNANNATTEKVAKIEAQNNLDQIGANADATIKVTKETQAGQNGFDETEISKMDTAVKNINAAFSSSENGKEKGVDVIAINGNGTYSFSPGVKANWYAHPVVKALFDNSNIEFEEMEYIIYQLGLGSQYEAGKFGYIFK